MKKKETKLSSIYLLDNNLVKSAIQGLKSSKSLIFHPAYRDDFLSVLQFLDSLILFDKIAVNSTVYTPYFNEVRDFLLEIQNKYNSSHREIFIFEGFDHVLEQSKSDAILRALDVFDLIINKEPIDPFFNDVVSTHKKGIAEAFRLLDKEGLVNKPDHALKFIKEQSEFYARNYFTAIYEDDRNLDMLMRFKSSMKSRFLQALTTMFSYFSYRLNGNLAYYGFEWGYSPSFSRDKLVKDLERTAYEQLSPGIKAMLEEKLRDIVNLVADTAIIARGKREFILGQVWDNPDIPFFGYIAYKLAKEKSSERVLVSAMKLREEAAEYRKWLHSSSWKDGIPQSRLMELEETERILREKYKLQEPPIKLSVTTVIDFFKDINIFSPFETLNKIFQKLRIKRKPHIIFLSNTIDRFLSVK